MKRALHIIAWGLVIILHGWFLWEAFQYFQQSHSDLTYVIGIAFLSGGALTFYYAQSFSQRQRLLLGLYGLLTSGSLCFSVYAAVMATKLWRLLSPLPALSPSEKWQLFQLSALCIGLIVGFGFASLYSGRLFFRTLKESAYSQ
ncbi:MAG TPA: hypothetical protein VGB77_06445 [Abditibacteriaceae bacterium]|jgi:hypothetical protein